MTMGWRSFISTAPAQRLLQRATGREQQRELVYELLAPRLTASLELA
jgi:hypothetical protein